MPPSLFGIAFGIIEMERCRERILRGGRSRATFLFKTPEKIQAKIVGHKSFQLRRGSFPALSVDLMLEKRRDKAS